MKLNKDLKLIQLPLHRAFYKNYKGDTAIVLFVDGDGWQIADFNEDGECVNGQGFDDWQTAWLTFCEFVTEDISYPSNYEHDEDKPLNDDDFFEALKQL